MSFETVWKQQDFAAQALTIEGREAFRYSMVPERGYASPKEELETFSQERIVEALERPEEELNMEDLSALLSPGADQFLEEMAQRALLLTRRRFGKVIQLYAPLYLSNYCHSTCSYCGFSFANKIERLTLTIPQVIEEAQILHRQGIRHILLLTGEELKETPLSYLGRAVSALRDMFSSVSIETYPLETKDYKQLRQQGLDGLAVYQETYDPRRYSEVHLGGMKKNMLYRLNCPDRAAEAGLRRIAIGALLGLSDPATDVWMTALHARYLRKHYWKTEIAISLPRLRPAAGIEQPPQLPDRIYARLLFALRIFLPDVGLTLSTREPAELRDQLAAICITQMSAGSNTEPGGYSKKGAEKQFSISDNRSIEEVSASLVRQGLEPVFVDWSPVLK